MKNLLNLMIVLLVLMPVTACSGVTAPSDALRADLASVVSGVGAALVLRSSIYEEQVRDSET